MSSYCDIDFANDYFSVRLNSSAWGDNEELQESALITASKMINRRAVFYDKDYNPFSYRLDEIDEDLPTELKEATCEQALYLLNLGTKDPTQPNVATIQGVSSMDGMTFDKKMSAKDICLECYVLIEQLGGELTGITSGNVGSFANW